ncbi:MAG: hypothetical protein HY722_10445 [Planctomycetes bacterium]|nr:hypothetical protein [Planctomycetota bacterium]
MASTTDKAAPRVARLDLAGTPREMGRTQGEALRGPIRELADERLERAVAWCSARGVPATVDSCLAAASASWPHHRELPRAAEELEGIAEGAGLAVERLLWAAAYTDLRDLVGRAAASVAEGECSAFVVPGECAEDGRLACGQTYDMHASAARHLVLQRRRPQGAPECLALSTSGCLPLIGLNARGIAVGTNNLRPRDPRPGVTYPALIAEALASGDLEDAVDRLTGCDRASGHHYYVCDPRRGFLVETSATRFALRAVSRSVAVHTNHYVLESMVEMEAEEGPDPTSPVRLAALAAALARTPLGAADLRAALSGHGGVCRHPAADAHAGPDAEPNRTCAAAVLFPGEGLLEWAAGNPCAAAWEELKL